MAPKENYILNADATKFMFSSSIMKEALHYASAIRAKSSRTKFLRTFDDSVCEFVETIIDNDGFKELTPRLVYALNKDREKENDLMEYSISMKRPCPYTIERSNKLIIQHVGSEQDVLDFLDIIPFIPSVMINISPDWKGKKINSKMIRDLTFIIEEYMKEGWYDSWKFVLECGSEGNHLHAHIVALFNKKRVRSTRSHIGHNNQTRQLKKYSSKVEGLEGIKLNIHRKVCNNELITTETLDYLIEEKKPNGHKNMKHVYCPILKVGNF